MIQIAFQLTPNELYKGLMAIANSRLGTKISRIIGIIFILGSLLILCSDIVLRHYPSWYSLFFIVFSLYVTFYLNIILWFQVKKLVKRNAQITEPVTYTFNETDYTLTGESFSTRMDYAKLYEVRTVPDFILLKVSEATAHLIPKRALSADQFAMLKELIQSIPKLKSKFTP